MNLLKGKRVLLLVSGGIAIYKSLDLISALKKEGADIFVVMSKKATKFIAPLTFQAMSGNPVLCKASESFPQISHISYANLADIALIAPASVNTIAKLAHGIADSLIVQTLLACKCEIFIAPSANVNMLDSPQNRANMDLLRQMGYRIIPPRVSLLACNIIANGAMAEVGEIIFHLKRAFCVESNGDFWRDKNVVITGGGSVEPIDAIRHISNDSSGKQASNLALAFYLLGANVVLIASKFPLNLPLGVKKIAVKTSAEFKNAIEAELDSCLTSSLRGSGEATTKQSKSHESKKINESMTEKQINTDSLQVLDSQKARSLPSGLPRLDCVKSRNDDKDSPSLAEGVRGWVNSTNTKNTIFISAAAISDYIVPQPAQGKLKKEQIGKEWDLHLIQNDDILAQISDKFGESCYIVGFKAESAHDLATANAKKMLESKGCDMVVLNVISESNKIGGERNEVRILTRESSVEIPQDSKLNISFKIAQNIAKNLVKK